MAEQPALPHVHGLRMRVTNLDQNGVPTPGTDQMYVTDAFTKVSVDPQYTNGGTIERKNAQGVTCTYYKSADSFTSCNIEIELCSPDPYLSAMLGGGKVITGDTPERTGFAAPALGAVADDGGLGIEVWGRRIDDGEEDVDSPYSWWLYPRVKNLRQGSFEHGDSDLVPAFTGQAYENPNWYDGPTNDWLSDSDRVFQNMPTDELPTAQVGYFDIAAS